MNKIALQLQYEEWAYRNGYSNEAQVSLVADFLNGLSAALNKEEYSLSVLPNGIHLSKGIREAFYNSGKELVNLKPLIAEKDVITAISNLFSKLHNEIKQAVAGSSVLASTGDCRGACLYNVGDRTEYLNYGW